MNGVRTDSRTAVLETTWGRISIRAGVRGVLACELPRFSRRSARTAFRVLGVRLPSGAAPVLRPAVQFALAQLAGRDPGKPPRLDASVFEGASPFRRAAWAAMRKIPRGRTLTYAELARRAGSPRAVRAVGGACGANPLPLFLPCHRVVAAGGRLGGFSSGPAWKIHLLSGEGALG